MKFSEYYGINEAEQYDWFDPVMSLDTHLFIDPFLIYAEEDSVFGKSHQKIIAFFNAMYRLIAQSAGNPESAYYKKAERELLFPEVEELCLGYTSSGTKGSGSGGDYAAVIANSIWEAIKAGLTEITHFEEIGLLSEGIGADRISDMTANLLREEFADYTKAICREHNTPTTHRHYPRGSYNEEKEFWIPFETDLPENPYNHRPLILVPKRYLRDLPTINAFDFWEFGIQNENETIRQNFNYDVSQRVSKRDIIQIARDRFDLVEAYLRFREEHGSEAYDLDLDQKGYLSWYAATAAYCEEKPLKFELSTVAELKKAVDSMIGEFRHFVEQNAGWKLLWNNRQKPKNETAAQLLFLGIIKHYCRANDIDVSKEANIGRGPVDFKVSRGYSLRALIELKLARNTKFWNGLSKQFPTYLKAENIKSGYFVVIVFSESDRLKIQPIQELIREVRQKTSCDLRPIIVDASWDHPSASLM